MAFLGDIPTGLSFGKALGFILFWLSPKIVPLVPNVSYSRSYKTPLTNEFRSMATTNSLRTTGGGIIPTDTVVGAGLRVDI